MLNRLPLLHGGKKEIMGEINGIKLSLMSSTYFFVGLLPLFLLSGSAI